MIVGSINNNIMNLKEVSTPLKALPIFPLQGVVMSLGVKVHE